MFGATPPPPLQDISPGTNILLRKQGSASFRLNSRAALSGVVALTSSGFPSVGGGGRGRKKGGQIKGRRRETKHDAGELAHGARNSHTKESSRDTKQGHAACKASESGQIEKGSLTRDWRFGQLEDGFVLQGARGARGAYRREI